MKQSRFKLMMVLCLVCLGWVRIAAADDFLSEEELYGEVIEEQAAVNSDPLEVINRAIFEFNDLFFLYVMDPIATGYTALTPDPIEDGAENFFHNLKYPVRFVGNVLQAKFAEAWVETGRFAINTTLGIGGVLTPANAIEGLAAVPGEDVGQALGVWGINEGAYLVLPIFGPTNVRDLIGTLGDRAVNPFVEPWTVLDEWEWRTAYSAGKAVVDSPEISDRYVQMKGTALDPYGALKNAYTQYRRAAIEQ